MTKAEYIFNKYAQETSWDEFKRKVNEDKASGPKVNNGETNNRTRTSEIVDAERERQAKERSKKILEERQAQIKKDREEFEKRRKGQ